MIKLRPDVRMGGVQPETVMAMNMVNEWCRVREWDTWIFSIMEGKHSSGSLHYVGYAFDFWPDTVADDPFLFGQEAAKMVKILLGQDFDVVFEKKPLHIHIEFQPKIQMNG